MAAVAFLQAYTTGAGFHLHTCTRCGDGSAWALILGEGHFMRLGNAAFIATLSMGLLACGGGGGSAAVNPCEQASCDPLASCAAEAGAAVCTCPAGYSDPNGDGSVCAAALPYLALAPSGGYTCGVRSDQTLWCAGYYTSTEPRMLRSGTEADWVAVAAGTNHVCGLRGPADARTLWCVGIPFTAAGNWIQVGTPAAWTALSAGSDTACAIRADGALFCGAGTFAQVGAAMDWTSAAPGQLRTCGIRAPGTAWCWGGMFGPSLPEQVGTASDWRELAVGADRVCGLREGGTLWCVKPDFWGDLTTPVQVGTDADWAQLTAENGHACGVKAGGELYCFGSNTYGELGTGTLAPSPDVPVRVGSATNWAHVEAGTNQTCALTTAGAPYCWGWNHWGELGIGVSPIHQAGPLQVGTGSNWSRVTGLTYHTCALQKDGTAWCWGSNASGALGDGNTQHRQTPTRVGSFSDWSELSAGDDYTCGRRAGTLWCWGQDVGGQVGDGASTASKLSPVQVGTSTDWTQVEAGYVHACGRRADGSLWCWGAGGDGELGDGGTSVSTSPKQVGTDLDWTVVTAGSYQTCALKSSGALYCWGYGYTKLPARVGTDSDWKTVRARWGVVCGTKQGGSLYCWTPPAAPVQIGTATNWGQLSPGYGVRTDGTIWRGINGIPTPATTGTDWVAVEAAMTHTCALKGAGTLWCWGLGQMGQMGHGDAWRDAPVPLLP